MQYIARHIRRHWRGTENWVIALIANLIAPRMLLPLIPIGFADTPVLVFSGVLLIWQVIGGWRNAGRVMQESGDMGISVAIYSGVGLAIVLAIVQAVDLISDNYLVPVDLSEHETVLLETRQEGQLIVVTGDISYDVNTALTATLAAFPQAKAVLLNSAGGNIFAGRALAFTISQNSMNTEVDEKCFSACTLAFMAGTARSLGASGALGFHGYAFDSELLVKKLNVQDQQAVDELFFAAQGVSPDFIDRIFEAPPTALWQPSRAEMLAAGVITH
ncbi:MAG: hypothetical protein ACI8YI_000715 [Paracoccaceae bacterium]